MVVAFQSGFPQACLTTGINQVFAQKFRINLLTANYPDRYFRNVYELGEISAECLHFARPLSMAMTDFLSDPYALYSEQPFLFLIYVGDHSTVVPDVYF